jgi:hypothetical protein
MSRLHRLGFGLALAACVGVAAAQEPAAGLASLDARALAQRAEAALRGDRTRLDARMTVHPGGLSRRRVLVFRSWDDRAQDRAFLVILSPARHAGSGFLRLPPNLWTYAPREERTSRIPLSMLHEPWMESDFTYDDLVHESSDVEDYTHRVLRIEEDADGRPGVRAHVLEYVPREEALVVWGRILGWIEVEHGSPLRRDFYDAEGRHVRTLRFEDFRQVGERRVPHRWIATPVGKRGRETRIEIDEIVFDSEFEPEIFTTGHLKKR